MLLKHVNDLLDMSRIEAGKLRIDRRATDLAELLRLIASHFEVLAADRGIEFVVVADAVPKVGVDTDKIQRVVMNLLGNAFKFTPVSGRVHVTLRRSSRDVVIDVDDSGPGVKPELRQAIFERFRQAEGGANRQAGGTGLGLAIAKEFVEMHRGRIDILDSPLGGARFEVTLPLDAAGEVTRPTDSGVTPEMQTSLDGVLEELRDRRRDAEPSSTTPGRLRVLVVEDNADMNRFIVQCLRSEFDIITAFDGAEGLAKALEHRPAIVVTDIMMPRVSGAEMVASMRETEELRNVPVLLLSARADEELRIQLLEDGASDFIVKPFAEAELRARVRTVARELAARDEASQARAKAQDALAAAQVARDDAERANRAKTEFLAAMSHELRTPLNSIQGHVQLLEMGVHGPIAAAQRESLERVQRSQRALQALIHDVLSYAKIEAGRLEYVRGTIDLQALVAETVEMVRPQAEAGKLTLESRIASPIMAMGDSDKVGQIIVNLLSNAIKFTDAGGRITIEGSARSEDSNDMVTLSVADTGCGIAPEQQQAIFDAFVQVHRNRRQSSEGLGLGLAISRELARGMGGDLRVVSEVGRGSTFTLTLPAN